MTYENEFTSILKSSLRPHWWLRAAAIKQFLRQQVLRRRVSSSANGKPTLLVYQMGKVGSTNLARELAQQDTTINVFQVHRMDEAYIKNLYAQYRLNSQSPYFFSNFVGREIRKKVFNSENGAEIKILCAVREPISRNISHFFQDIERFTPRKPLPSSVDDLRGIFIEKFEHKYPEDWFDKEFKVVTGIDVLNEGFDRKAGFQIYRNGRIKALVYKIESTNSEGFLEEFQSFTGLSYESSAKHNVGGSKKYGDLYSAFKSGMRLPSKFCEEQYASRYATTFYTPEELLVFQNKFSDISS